MCILAHVIITDTNICFKCQNQQFKVVCAATFLKKCKSCTLLLEMLSVPHCVEQNPVLQASWDYAAGSYLNDPVDLKIWAFTACIRPKQGKKWFFICWLIIKANLHQTSYFISHTWKFSGVSFLSVMIHNNCWKQFITLLHVKWMPFGNILSTVCVASR